MSLHLNDQTSGWKGHNLLFGNKVTIERDRHLIFMYSAYRYLNVFNISAKMQLHKTHSSENVPDTCR